MIHSDKVTTLSMLMPRQNPNIPPQSLNCKLLRYLYDINYISFTVYHTLTFDWLCSQAFLRLQEFRSIWVPHLRNKLNFTVSFKHSTVDKSYFLYFQSNSSAICTFLWVLHHYLCTENIRWLFFSTKNLISANIRYVTYPDFSDFIVNGITKRFAGIFCILFFIETTRKNIFLENLIHAYTHIF